MKKITLLLTFMLVSVMGCYGQASGYGFSASTGTYSETSAGATLLPLVRADTYMSPAQNIGFNFVYEGITYTQFKMSSNGFISFNMTGTSSLTGNDFAAANTTSRPIIAPLWDDLDGATPASSVASYELTGTAPNQVLTVEWRNWEWNYASSTPVLSFQVKLYETTNVIEFVYRQEATAVASGSASIGIGSASGSAAGSYLNVTSVATPAVSNGTTVTNLNTKPNTGQIYRWTPPTCAAPSSVVVSNITTTNATISWSAPAIVPSSGYEYYYSTSNVAPTGAGIATSNLTEILTPLSSGTDYFVWMRSNCGSGDFSGWTGPVTFRTVCDVYTVPFLQDFTTYVPNCWQEADNGDAVAGPATFGSSSWSVDGFANVGTTGAFKYNVFTTGANDWIMSPVITIPATGYELKFDAAATQYASSTAPTTPWESDDSIQVLVSNGTSNWTVLYTYNDINVPSNAGSTNIIDLDAYAGQNVRFAFRAIEGAANGAADIDFSIDNFEVRLTPACSNPIGLLAANVTSASADVSWTPVAGSVNYEYVLDTVATNPAGSGTSTMATTFNATLLSPLTTYYFHVRNNCGAIFSTWSTVSFTTLATPPVNDTCGTAVTLTPGGSFATNAVTGTIVGATTVTGLTYACQTSRSADVWYSVIVPASGSLTIETQADGTSLLTDTVVSVFSGTCGSLTEVGCDDDLGTGNFSLVTLTGQTPAATLYVGVWKYGTQTNDTFKVSAYDASLGTNSFDNANFSYYPNPVKNILNLSYTETISNVAVFNLLGQEVMTKKVNSNQSQVDMTGLASGTYVVKVTADNQVKMIKVIKE